jgi:chaperonin GroEL
VTETEIAVRKELAEHTADALRGVVREGLLPGGGAALLACRPAMQRLLNSTTDEDERAAYRILSRALEEPLRTIVTNAGYDAADVMAEIRQVGASGSANPSAFYGFDVISGQVVDTARAGILDVASVQKAAVRSAIASAALGLTIDVLVHHKKPELALTPK